MTYAKSTPIHTKSAHFPWSPLTQTCRCRFDVSDLRLGAVVQFYGRSYKIYDSDEFTKRFLTKLGLPVGEPEAPPEDPFSQKQARESAAKQALRPYDKQDKLKQFLERDRQVFTFPIPLPARSATTHFSLPRHPLHPRSQACFFITVCTLSPTLRMPKWP